MISFACFKTAYWPSKHLGQPPGPPITSLSFGVAHSFIPPEMPPIVPQAARKVFACAVESKGRDPYAVSRLSDFIRLLGDWPREEAVEAVPELPRSRLTQCW